MRATRDGARTRRDSRPSPSRLRARTSPGRLVPHHRLLLACTAVIAAALPLVAFTNARLNEGAFREQELEIQLTLLREEGQALAGALRVAETPRTIERRARKLGLVPAESPASLNLQDGRIVGEPRPAGAPSGTVDPRPDDVAAPRVLIPDASAPTSAEASSSARADKKPRATPASPGPQTAASEAASAAHAATPTVTR